MSMSFFAAFTASRHLTRRLLLSNLGGTSASCRLRIGGGGLPATRRHSSLNGSRGSGLPRARNGGRRTAGPKPSRPKALPSSPSSPSSGEGSAPSYERADPHLIANEMVSRPTFAEGRAPGTESVTTLTREQKLSNYAMATGLLTFVSYVFYYSLASVGGGKNAKALLFGADEMQQPQPGEATSSPGFEEFLREANEGRSEEERRLGAEGEARGEALALEGAVVGTGAATDEEERAMARTAGFVEEEEEGGATTKKRRPLWKRVVFFWRRE